MNAQDIKPIPPEALEQLDDVRRRHSLSGLPVTVSLRLHRDPRGGYRWDIVIGDVVVRRGGRM